MSSSDTITIRFKFLETDLDNIKAIKIVIQPLETVRKYQFSNFQ